MKGVRRTIVRTLVLLTGLNAFAVAQAADTYDIDPVHTQILFFVSHLGYSNSEGEFHKFAGKYRFDPADWGTASVNVTIETESLSLDDAAWDKHLKSADFFNVEKFPQVTFRSTRVEKTGENTGRVAGELTLLGVTKPVTLDLQFNKAAEFPMSKKFKSGFSATTTIKRSEWGMTFGVPMGIGDEVKIRLEVEGFRE